MPDLTGVHVLVTRPRHQAQGLCDLIAAQGGEVILFPVIEITEPSDLKPLHAVIDRLELFDIAIFISANAVIQGLAAIRARRELPRQLRLAAVGEASARALAAADSPVNIVPRQRFDSEGLLATEALQQVAGKRIVIFRGEGGREHLADTLRQRGAQVEYAECYRRCRPQSSALAPLLARWKKNEVDIVVVTSNEGLENLFAMLGEEGRGYLMNTPLVVISARGAERARELGMQLSPIITRQASDTAIVEAIRAWRISH